jgi:hypothetical protein
MARRNVGNSRIQARQKREEKPFGMTTQERRAMYPMWWLR